MDWCVSGRSARHAFLFGFGANSRGLKFEESETFKAQESHRERASRLSLVATALWRDLR
jgi:hypothetical protein